jgi:uncharacterized protein YkwD
MLEISVNRIGVVGSLLLLVSCGSGNSLDNEEVGQAQLEIAEAPAGVQCIRITATGSRAVVQNVSVTPGQSTTVSMGSLPLGNVKFSGDAFDVPCASINANSTPSWTSAPVAATVSVSPAVTVTLAMRRNGQAKVIVDFNDDAGAPTLDCTNASTWPTEWSTLEQELVNALNARRTQGGLCSPPSGTLNALVYSPELSRASRCHSLDMSNNNFLSHTGSDGSTFFDRARTAGFAGNPRAEVIASGFSTSATVLDAWLGASSQCTVLAESSIRYVGVGYVAQGNYWTLVTGLQ